MREEDIIDQANRVVREITHFKRMRKTAQELQSLRQGRGTASLQLLAQQFNTHELETALDNAIDQADTEAHSSFMQLDELLK